MSLTQPRERAVPCQFCGPRGTTWNVTAVCDACTRRRLATLVEHPTQITETLWGPKLPADSCTEADTALAWQRWCRDHTGGDA